MTNLGTLAHTLSEAWCRAALCRDMGEHGMAEFWDRKAAETEREIALLDKDQPTSLASGPAEPRIERARVLERGVS